jgi:hypothetical protein
MERIKRATVNLPAALLRDARAVTGKGVTDTLIEGMKLLKRSRAHAKAARLKGKLRLHIDLDASRKRRRR